MTIPTSPDTVAPVKKPFIYDEDAAAADESVDAAADKKPKPVQTANNGPAPVDFARDGKSKPPLKDTFGDASGLGLIVLFFALMAGKDAKGEPADLQAQLKQLHPEMTPSYVAASPVPTKTVASIKPAQTTDTAVVPLAPVEHFRSTGKIELAGKTVVYGDSTGVEMAAQFKGATNMAVVSAGQMKGKQLASLDNVDMHGSRVFVEYAYNDAGKLPNTTPAVMAGYQDLYKQHVDQIKQNGGTPILIGLAPAQKALEYKDKNGVLSRQTPEALEAYNIKLAAINDKIMEVARQEGLTYVSPAGKIILGTGQKIDAPEGSVVQKRAGDGLHFSAEGAHELAQVAARAATLTPMAG